MYRGKKAIYKYFGVAVYKKNIDKVLSRNPKGSANL